MPDAERPGGSPAGSRSDDDPHLDAWLVSHAARGDVASLEALVRRHQAQTFRVAYRLLGDRQHAEDVAQDVWLQVWLSVGTFTGSSMFSTWLYRITVNKALNAARRRQRSREEPVDDGALDGEHPVAAAPSGEDVALLRSRDAAVRDAVRALPDELRAVFVLRHFEDLSYDRIAAVLDLREPTVRSRLVRARRQVAAELGGWR